VVDSPVPGRPLSNTDVTRILQAGVEAQAMAIHNEKEAVRIGGLWLEVRQACAHALKQYRRERAEALKHVAHWKTRLDESREEGATQSVAYISGHISGWSQQALCWLNAITILRGFLAKARP